MRTIDRLIRGGVLVIVMGMASSAFAAPYGAGDYAPRSFNPDGASAIGSARQRFDRAQYDSYRGDPGAQFILRQKRQNLCRNTPEMC